MSEQYEVIERKGGHFSHCIFNSQDYVNEDILKKVNADFFSFKTYDGAVFIHATPSKNLTSILNDCLKQVEGEVSSHLGNGIYTILIHHDILLENGITGFFRFLNDLFESTDEISIVSGWYVGPYEYCFIGTENHKGYTILKENVSTNQLLEHITIQKDNWNSQDFKLFVESSIEKGTILYEKAIFAEIKAQR